MIQSTFPVVAGDGILSFELQKMPLKYRLQYFFIDDAASRRAAIDQTFPAAAGADERAGS